MPIAKVLTFSGIAMIKDSFLCFYNDFIADSSSPVHAAMLTDGASCQETSCSDPYINRNIARAALTAVWRYRLFLEAGRRVPVVIPVPAAGRAEGCLSVIPSLS